MANKYKCKSCGFEWVNPKKEYANCPDCQSKNIKKIDKEEIQKTVGQPGIGRRGDGGGVGAGDPPRVCKCTQCGYESPKTPGIPCKNS